MARVGPQRHRKRRRRSERRLNEMRNCNSVITVRIQAKHASLLINTIRQGEIIRNACNCKLWDYQDVEDRELLCISLTANPPHGIKTVSLEKTRKGHETIT
jgi:hypothetical protein